MSLDTKGSSQKAQPSVAEAYDPDAKGRAASTVHSKPPHVEDIPEPLALDRAEGHDDPYGQEANAVPATARLEDKASAEVPSHEEFASTFKFEEIGADGSGPKAKDVKTTEPKGTVHVQRNP